MIFSKKYPKSKANLRYVPESPGVYAFCQDDGQILYIGKAINLRTRLSSYFSEATIGKTKAMFESASLISYIRVASDIESLILEANLVKQFQPKYNVLLKDDKHPLYIRTTNDHFPRVLTARKIDKREKDLAFYGPFPTGGHVRRLLKYLRGIVSFSTHPLGKKACLNSQIGLCNPCPNVISTSEEEKRYKKNIGQIIKILDNKMPIIKRELIKQIEIFSREQKYEEALSIRQKLDSLNYITQPVTDTREYLLNPNFESDKIHQELSALAKLLNFNNLKRIECFDVAHLGGKYTTASMVVMVDGRLDNSLYRHFKIENIKGADDYAALKQAVKRRLIHCKDWGTPNLLVIDGGKGQVERIRKYFNKVVGLAKKYETLVVPLERKEKVRYIEIRLSGPAGNLLVRLRNEAHRFARRYHHRLIKKSISNWYENNH